MVLAIFLIVAVGQVDLKKEKELELYAVSYEGAAARLLSKPGYFNAANPRNDLGHVGDGITVEWLGEVDDGVLPKTWSKVRVLEGPLKSKVGWIFTPQLRDIPNRVWSDDKVDGGGDQVARTKPRRKREVHSLSGDCRLLSGPGYENALNLRSKVADLGKDTIVEKLDPTYKGKLLDGTYPWVRVTVRDSRRKGKDGWIAKAYLGPVAFQVYGSSLKTQIGQTGAFGPGGGFIGEPDKSDQEFGGPNANYLRNQQDRDAKLLHDFLRGETTGNIPIALTPKKEDIATIVDPMFNRFMNATAGEKSFSADSRLSELIAKSSQFEDRRDAVNKKISTELRKLAQSGNSIDLRDLQIAQLDAVHYPLFSISTFVLRAVLGSTQGLKVSIKNPDVEEIRTGTDGLAVKVRMTVVYEIYDVFGTDNEDILLPPTKGPGIKIKNIEALNAMWRLQRRGVARPFKTRVVVESPFEDTLAIPSPYRRVFNSIDLPSKTSP